MQHSNASSSKLTLLHMAVSRREAKSEHVTQICKIKDIELSQILSV